MSFDPPARDLGDKIDKQTDLIEGLKRQQDELKSLVRSLKGAEGGAADVSADCAPPRKVALLTAGGLAPCLSSSCGALIKRYTELYPDTKIICYVGGYKGLLLGDSIECTPELRANAGVLHLHGGSPIGNSRVKLTNVKDCLKRGLVKEGQIPQQVAADQLVKDGVDVLHTIGGDDTNIAAADLAAFLKQNNYNLTVIGLPKTIDNDVYPIKQSLGAWTAAEEGAKFFANVVNEQSSNPRMLIIHEVMGRSCGYLTAATAKEYRSNLKSRSFVPSLNLHFEKLDVHAVFIPEIPVDIESEGKRLKQVMDTCGIVNLFISEGAGLDAIVKEMESRGEELPRDAFGHVKLDAVNPGEWFASRFSDIITAEKVMVPKSGYFGRAAAANVSDLNLIKGMCDHAVDCAVRRRSGVIGHDEDQGGRLRAIEFERIKGGKPFDTSLAWFREMMAEIQAPVRLEVPKPIVRSSPAYVPKLYPGQKLPKKVAILSAGGLAPCLSSAIGGLIERYNECYPSVEIICYLGGYKGLLLGDFIQVDELAKQRAGILHLHGGSAIGNSRVKLTNVKDCLARGLVKEGEDPQKVAADQLVKDGVDVLHTVGGDDTNIAAADLAAFLKRNDYNLTVIGLPKTIDNDVYPIKQSLGAWTAAEQGATYFSNVVYESSANPRMLIVHEVMGRSCGYLTAATAHMYHNLVMAKGFCPEIGLRANRFDVHAVFIPEIPVDITSEAARLKDLMNTNDCVNIFISEGAGVDDIVKEKEAMGETLPRDAFGHVKLDAVKPGEWFAEQFARMIGAEKVLVQKSGYFSRAAPANVEDLRLIKSCTDLAVECALRGEAGVIGHDEDNGGVLRAIEFERIKGGKPFDTTHVWFTDLLREIGQKKEYEGVCRMERRGSNDMANTELRVKTNVRKLNKHSTRLFT